MAVQRHPVESYDKKLNFWKEFPDYTVHQVFGQFYRANVKAKTLKASSNFMWLLTLCYDRKSSLFAQPAVDKWEAAGEDLFDDGEFVQKLIDEPENCKEITLQLGDSMPMFVVEFERSIDSPLGTALRTLENKLSDRTIFINSTDYTLDSYETIGNKSVLVKGTALQLDKMFVDTEKIAAAIQKAMDALNSSTIDGSTKGGQMASLGDSGKI